MSRTVAEIMDTDPVAVRPEDPVETVVHAMHDNELTGVPVIDAGGVVVGIITDDDLLLYDQEEDVEPPPSLQIMGGVIYLGSVKHWEERIRKSLAGTAADLMTADPVTVGADATAREAGRLIAEHKHNRLPVVDDAGRLLGIVTRVDVLEALLEER
jgi:CBS domain-containing protein